MLLRQLQYFIAIVDCNSFTEAAERCFISQSAISQQIAALEKDLGVKLIKRENHLRGRRKLTLTPAGEYFYQEAKAIVDKLEEIRRETVRIGSDDELHLKIGYLASYDGEELQSAIIEFSKIYPEVVVSVSKGTHEDLYFALKNCEVSLVLNDQRRAFSDEYENFILNQSPAYIEVSSSHSLASKEFVTVKELEAFPCILTTTKGRENTERDFYENTLGIGKQFLFTESLDEARLMAMSGRGYLLVESVKRQTTLPLVRLEVRREDSRPIVRTYCAFWQKAKTSYYIEEFADILRKKFTE